MHTIAINNKNAVNFFEHPIHHLIGKRRHFNDVAHRGFDHQIAICQRQLINPFIPQNNARRISTRRHLKIIFQAVFFAIHHQIDALVQFVVAQFLPNRHATCPARGVITEVEVVMVRMFFFSGYRRDARPIKVHLVMVHAEAALIDGFVRLSFVAKIGPSFTEDGKSEAVSLRPEDPTRDIRSIERTPLPLPLIANKLRKRGSTVRCPSKPRQARQHSKDGEAVDHLKYRRLKCIKGCIRHR